MRDWWGESSTLEKCVAGLTLAFFAQCVQRGEPETLDPEECERRKVGW
jgi:hypothetical protein